MNPVVTNLSSARFECVYPSCGGICCMNGRPAIDRDEEDRLRENLHRFLDRLRPEARAHIARSGFLDRRHVKDGLPTLAVSRGWCVFFRDGCVLHQVGAEEGDERRHKPWRCSLFPIARDRQSGEWRVRQRGLAGERWDLFCLNPDESERTADTTLEEEVAHLRRIAPRLGPDHAPPTS